MAYLIGSADTARFDTAHTIAFASEFQSYVSGNDTDGLLASATGTGATLSLYIEDWLSATNLKAVLYESNAEVASTIIPASVGTGVVDVALSIAATSGEVYRLALYSEGGEDISLYTDTGGLTLRYEDGGTGSYTTPIDPYPAGSYSSFNEFYWALQDAPAGLTIDSTDAAMAKQSTFGMTVSNPPVTPTASNTSLTLGAIQIPLSQATNTSGDTWDLEFPIGDIPRQADGTGYDWTLDVGTAVVANTAPVVSLVGNASIPLTVGDTYTEQGATVADSEDGVLTIGDPIFSPPLDMATAGTYVATYSVTDSGGLVGTATRSVVVSAASGGGGGSEPTLPAPTLFSDSFESGNLASPTAGVDTGNFAWADMAWSYVVNTATDTLVYRSTGAVNESTPSNTWESRTGDHALFLKHSAGQNMAEQRFTLDSQPDLWMRYWLRVPDNFEHGSLNNKFLSIWGDTYDANGTVTWQTRPDGSGGANIVLQDGGVISSEALSTPFISVPSDRGRWMQVVVHARLESSSNAGDGVLALYRRWEDESDFTTLHEKTDCINQWGDGAGYRAGFFLGWANDPYTVQTEWMIDDVEVSDQSLITQTSIQPSLPTPTLFADSFESGSMAAPTASVDTANFAWGSHAWSYLVDVNTDQILWRSSGASTEVITPNDWEAKTGNRCLRFNYIGGADTSEQRFSFDAQDELWLRYWIRVPTNYTHPSGSDVHKFLAMWNTTYQAGVDGGATAWMSLFNNGSGGSNASITHMNGNTGSDLAYEQSTPFISVPADRGRWMQLVVRLKTESSAGAADGIIQTWRRWDGDTDFTALHSKTDAALNEQTGGWQGGYFMGWVNDTYAADTEWLIDDVELSDQSLIAAPEQATEIFELAFNGNNVDTSTQAGGGSVAFFANAENGVGSGISGTNITVVDITDDPLFSNIKGLRDLYQQDYNAYSFANQTVFLEHPERPKFYMRMRIKWSSNWQWGSDQLKFCKNKGQDPLDGGAEVSTNFPKFDGDGDLYLTKLAPDNPAINDLYVHPVLKETGNPNYRQEDDINNNFGGAGIDANWSPTLDTWYWIEWEIDAVSAGSTQGSYKCWVDGQLYFQLDDVQISASGDSLFSAHQLGHVWQNSGNNNGPTQDIYMEFHSIGIYDQRPTNLPQGIA